MALDIISVILSSVSVYQGWANRPQDVEKCKGMDDFLNLLSKVDELFFSAKLVHDGSESFMKTTKDISRILRAEHDDISPNQLQQSLDAYIFHLKGMLKEKYPFEIYPLSGDIVMLAGNDILTADIKNSIGMLYRFYAMMDENIISLHSNAFEMQNTSLSNNDNKIKIKALITEADYLIREILTSADKTIYYGANIMAYLHTEARRALQ